ncbi:hypothetical protein ACHAW5_005255, partial [Stephanodiscus triporus]
GIARLPVDELRECGISYAFTNCRQDSHTYPILHDRKRVARRPDKLEDAIVGGEAGEREERIVCSQHLEASSTLFADVRRENRARRGEGRPAGRVMFFCVAGQNRSAVLAAATMLIHGKSLGGILRHCARQRPFVLENVGFQRQLVELEAIVESLTRGGGTTRDRFRGHWDLVRHARSASRAQQSKRVRMMMGGNGDDETDGVIRSPPLRSESHYEVLAGTKVEVELLIPGLCTMEVRIPKECTIPTLKNRLMRHVNDNLLRHDECPSKIAKSWLILAMFGSDDMWDLPLEVEAVELRVQLERMKLMFGLNARLKKGTPYITWDARCRFALVIFSVVRYPKETPSTSTLSDCEKAVITADAANDDIDLSMRTDQVPWTFVHQERPNAPATLLENTLRSTHLRAWDFVTGKALASKLPIVFSYADDPRDKRAFMMVSRSAGTLQQFQSPGEGDILGMGANAIVHRVQLAFTLPDGGHRDENWTSVNVGLKNDTSLNVHSNKTASMSIQSNNTTSESIQSNTEEGEEYWDAAVKRPFSLAKMLIFLQHSSEAGLAKRLRLANLLNSDKRVLYFYGLGLGLSTNAYNQNEYKFELMLLSKYDEHFSSYTMRCFMEEYITIISSLTDEDQRMSIQRMQSEFTITSVKVLLVSLLNAFRDLTLMGIQAFDFNHLNNVLVSRDYQSVRLIDIDGNSQGSVEYPSVESAFDKSCKSPNAPKHPPQKPCLNVDLNILLPSVIEQLILGKGRGRSFVSNTRSVIWRAEEEMAKEMIERILLENFYPGLENEETDSDLKCRVGIHVKKVAEWFYDLVKKKTPWTNWTHDIYDAMRCIDHLPIS